MCWAVVRSQVSPRLIRGHPEELDLWAAGWDWHALAEEGQAVDFELDCLRNVLAANANTIVWSCYSDNSMTLMTRVSLPARSKARQELLNLDLIAFDESCDGFGADKGWAHRCLARMAGTNGTVAFLPRGWIGQVQNDRVRLVHHVEPNLHMLCTLAICSNQPWTV